MFFLHIHTRTSTCFSPYGFTLFFTSKKGSCAVHMEVVTAGVSYKEK